MRLAPLLLLAALAGAPSLAAQVRDTLARDTTGAVRGLPREVADRAYARYNAPAALRASGTLVVPAEQTVTGDVAVLEGPLTVSGHVTGDVVVVNGDVSLRDGARIDGALFVVGGVVESQRGAVVAGGIEQHLEPLDYELAGERLVPARGSGELEQRMRRLLRRYERSTSRIRLTTDGAYNRVEGLAILLGPQLRLRRGWGRVRAEAYGIMRTADQLAWDSDNIGHDATVEVQRGSGEGIAVGGRLYDLVAPVERWQLRDTEVGLASFFLHRDFRDYYARHGAEGWVRLFRAPAELTLGYGEERWGSRAVRDPFSLFRDDDPWRASPEMDEGRARLLTARLTLDTRNDVVDPWTGWLVSAEVERGSSGALQLAPTSFGVRDAVAGDVVADARWVRGFLDLRRYNRVSTEGQLNLRLVLGGWLGGDPLPMQRRLSLGGAGTLPGYDFRDAGTRPDVLACNAPVPPNVDVAPGVRFPEGRPAQCERILLAQAEYRGDLRISIGGRDGDDDERPRRRWLPFDVQRLAQWVVFADAGRGWLVTGSAPAPLRLGSGELPPLRSLRADVGAGLDFDYVGVFVAKSTTDGGEPPNVFVRLRHRF
jgi:hypothetical protein